MRFKKEIKTYLLKYIKNHTHTNEDGCHIWNNSNVSRDGYGRVDFVRLRGDIRSYLQDKTGNKAFIQSHKLAHIVNGGSLTKQRPYVLHRCNNKGCCNISHLYEGNNSHNQLDANVKSNRKTYERYGPFKIWLIEQDILKGLSFKRIAKRYDSDISHISRHIAPKLEAKGYVLNQRKNRKDTVVDTFITLIEEVNSK